MRTRGDRRVITHPGSCAHSVSFDLWALRMLQIRAGYIGHFRCACAFAVCRRVRKPQQGSAPNACGAFEFIYLSQSIPVTFERGVMMPLTLMEDHSLCAGAGGWGARLS